MKPPTLKRRTLFLAATVSLTIFTSAYLGEVWRSIVKSIPKAQWEGADALGLSFLIKLYKVILPQAFKLALPPTVGFLVQIIKGTSMAYIIDFNDLMRWGKKIANSPVNGTEPFVVFPIVAIIYFCLCSGKLCPHVFLADVLYFLRLGFSKLV